jgi:hypothetical protein
MADDIGKEIVVPGHHWEGGYEENYACQVLEFLQKYKPLRRSSARSPQGR